jgi:hypothetical protein
MLFTIIQISSPPKGISFPEFRLAINTATFKRGGMITPSGVKGIRPL